MDRTANELIERLRRNPDDGAALAALRSFYRRASDYASLVNLLQGWAERTRDSAGAAQALFEAGELAVGALSDRPRALTLFERCLQRDLLHVQAAKRLEALYTDSGDLRRLTEFLERYAAELEKINAPPQIAAPIHHRTGELWEQSYKRSDKAVLHYKRAFELDPNFVPAIYAAREIYRQAGNMKAAASLCEMEAKAESNPERKVALLRELAHMRGDSLGDVEGAVVALKRAMAIAPTDLSVMRDLTRVYLSRAERTRDEAIAREDRTRAAEVYFQMAQRLPAAEAFAVLGQGLDACPEHEECMTSFERAAEQLGQTQELAIRWVNYLSRAAPSIESAHRRKLLGHAYLEAGQLDYAIQCFEGLVEAGDADAASRLVELYRMAGRDQDVLRPLTVAARGLPPDQRVPRLREIVDILDGQNELEKAAGFARELLALDAGDANAIDVLSRYYRKVAQYAHLRDLLLAAARVPGIDTDLRKTRLHEVASIAERHLADLDGALEAHRNVLALDSRDASSRTELIRLLELRGSWDDLAHALEKEAFGADSKERRIDLYTRLALVQRDKRRDMAEACAALKQLRELKPDDAEVRDALVEVLLELGEHLDAVPLLESQIKTSSDRKVRAQVKRRLALVLEDNVLDDEAAFAAWTSLLEDEPRDLESIERMLRIDEQNNHHARRLQTLLYRADFEEPAPRAKTLKECADLAYRHLRDPERAAALLVRALELSATDVAVLDALTVVYEDTGNYRELVQKLRDRLKLEKDRALRGELGLRIARTLAHKVGNQEAAAEAYVEVLRAVEAEEALEFLAQHGRQKGDMVGAEEYLRRLQALLDRDPQRQRDVALMRAELLHRDLKKPREALDLLRLVVTKYDPSHLGALQQLARISLEQSDYRSLADALERQLQIVEDGGLATPIAQQLADLFEHQLKDSAKATATLVAWHGYDRTDPEPLRRLIPLYETQGKTIELKGALDALIPLVRDIGGNLDELHSLILKAGRLCMGKLKAPDDAWDLLSPLVYLDNVEAETLLRELAEREGQGEALSRLYHDIASRLSDAKSQAAKLSAAAQVEETMMAQPARALETTLQAYGLFLDDGSYLEEVERLACIARAWPRLQQVYDTLLRRETRAEGRSMLLQRLAGILERDARDPAASFERLSEALQEDPHDDALLEKMEQLAAKAGKTDSLFALYDVRMHAAENDEAFLASVTRSAQVADQQVRNRGLAATRLALVIGRSERSGDELFLAAEQCARELDKARRGASEGSLLRLLLDGYRKFAQGEARNDSFASRLLLRSASLLDAEFSDFARAFEDNKLALMRVPGDTQALSMFLERAERLKKWNEADIALVALSQEVFDSKALAGIYRARGTVLTRLGRHSEAAESLLQVRTLAPGDAADTAALVMALKKAQRHQDLLVVLEDDLIKTRDRKVRVELQRQIATLWEYDFKNKFEALEAWRAVLELEPENDEGVRAVARLERKVRPQDDDEIVEEEDVEIEDAAALIDASVREEAAPLGDFDSEVRHDFGVPVVETAESLAGPPSLSASEIAEYQRKDAMRDEEDGTLRERRARQAVLEQSGPPSEVDLLPEATQFAQIEGESSFAGEPARPRSTVSAGAADRARIIPPSGDFAISLASVTLDRDALESDAIEADALDEEEIELEDEISYDIDADDDVEEIP